MKNMILISRKNTGYKVYSYSESGLGILNASMAWAGVPLGKQKTIASFPCFLCPLQLDLEVVLQ